MTFFWSKKPPKDSSLIYPTHVREGMLQGLQQGVLRAMNRVNAHRQGSCASNQMVNSAVASSGVIRSGWMNTPYQQPPPAPTPLPSYFFYDDGEMTMTGLLFVRLTRGKRLEAIISPRSFFYKGIEVIDVREKSGEVAIYLSVKNGDPFTITDDAALFPSDALIAKLQLLIE